MWSTYLTLALIPPRSLKYREGPGCAVWEVVVGAVLTHLPKPGATAVSQRAPVEGSAFRYWIISSSIAFEMEEGFILWIW